MQYVLDHWSDYRSWRVNVCGDSNNTVPDFDLSGNQYSLQRLQVEVDQFFLRAAQQIISAHRYVCTALRLTSSIPSLLVENESIDPTPPVSVCNLCHSPYCNVAMFVVYASCMYFSFNQISIRYVLSLT